MVIRLGEYVVEGGLYSDGKYGTKGWLLLRDDGQVHHDGPMRLRFDVTGDPDPDLKGLRIWFAPAEDDGTQRILPRSEYEALRYGQTGVAGTMTAQGWMHALPCPREEYEHRAALGEAPPTEWRRRLYIEWFGPNGLVTIELAGAEVFYCTRMANRDNEDDNGDWEPLPNRIAPPWLDGPREPMVKSAFEWEAENFAVEQRRPFEASPEEQDYLDDFLADQRAVCDIADDEAEADARRHLEDFQRLEYCMECDLRVPFSDVFGDLSKLPAPESLDDVEVERRLKSMLARLVTYGVILDVCRHFTPRDCYRLLLEQILPVFGYSDVMVGTDWNCRYSTYEYCPECDEEIQKEIESWEREMREKGEGDED